MLYQTLISAFLPLVILAAPTSLSSRQDPACAPLQYTISDFTYTTSADQSDPHVSFNFQSAFNDPSIINDASSAGATCDSTGTSLDGFPTETECSTGRANLLYDLRARVDQTNFQIIHTWTCNGHTWMSSTPHQVLAAPCIPNADGSSSCTAEPQNFAPANVRQICSAPTCP